MGNGQPAAERRISRVDRAGASARGSLAPLSRAAFARYWPLALVCAGAAVLYFWRLGEAPIVVGGDEAHFALHAASIAANGRDIDGRFLPLFFRIDLKTWYQPMLVYLMVPCLKLFGVSEWTMRAP